MAAAASPAVVRAGPRHSHRRGPPPCSSDEAERATSPEVEQEKQKESTGTTRAPATSGVDFGLWVLVYWKSSYLSVLYSSIYIKRVESTDYRTTGRQE